MTTPRQVRLVHAFVRASDTLVADYDVADLLTQLVEDCVDLLDVDAAGLLLGDQRAAAKLVAASSHDLRLLELFQLQVDEGPCLDAMTTGAPVIATDLLTQRQRWPRFTHGAHAAGFTAAHAVPLRLRDQVIGALGLFATRNGAFPDADVRVAQALADVATIGVLHHRAWLRSDTLTTQLQTALTTRGTIEQAKGVLAERTGMKPDQAFTALRRYARSHRLKLGAVAAGVIDGSIEHTALDAAARPT